MYDLFLISSNHEQQYRHQDIRNQHNDVGQSVHMRSATRSSSVCMTLSLSLISSRAWTANIYLNVIVQLGQCKQIIQGLTYLTLKRDIKILGSKVHGANMGPTWVLSAPDGPHVGPMNLAIRDIHSSLDHQSPIFHWRDLYQISTSMKL